MNMLRGFQKRRGGVSPCIVLWQKYTFKTGWILEETSGGAFTLLHIWLLRERDHSVSQTVFGVSLDKNFSGGAEEWLRRCQFLGVGMGIS